MNTPATWRGETVRIVSRKGAKVQIARKGKGLRWVRADEVNHAAETRRAKRVAAGQLELL